MEQKFNKRLLKAQRAFTLAQIGLLGSHIASISTLFIGIGLNHSGADFRQVFTTISIGAGLGIASMMASSAVEHAEKSYMLRHANDPVEDEEESWLDPEM